MWLALLLVVLFATARPLGEYVAAVLERRPTPLDPILGPVERGLARLAGLAPVHEQGWRHYALALLTFHALGFALTYAVQRLQGVLPLNPQHLPGVPPALAFDTAVSFVTNTNWQSYAGEAVMSPLTQMLVLGVQNFLSAAAGIGVMAALVRGLARSSAATVGDFWSDLTRITLYVLLPLSLLLALVLVSQGVVQSFEPPRQVALIEPLVRAPGDTVATQTLVLGPVASQVAIKQLGTNGGGYYNANSAHPFENPTPLSNLLELVAILLLPSALCLTFGRMVGDLRQGWALWAAMLLLFVPMALLAMHAEHGPDPLLAPLAAGGPAAAGMWEGKEVRHGLDASALWAAATTAASNGSVNAMHDSLSPLGGLVAMALIQLGEVVFGGVGSGVYGMLVFALIAVFMAGLMVGRSPEYLGKKIEAREMKLASLVVLLPPFVVLAGTALAVSVPVGLAGVGNTGAHGFSEVLYAFSSAANNNGSAFAGLDADSPFYHATLGLAMLAGRFGLIVPVLALAGSLAAKKKLAAGAGTLPTHTSLFVLLLAAVVVIVGALTFVPALALGPVVEQLMAQAGR